jgi:ankyrin repeat protein
MRAISSKPNLAILAMVRLLIERGADAGRKNNYGISPPDLAERMGNTELLQVLT